MPRARFHSRLPASFALQTRRRGRRGHLVVPEKGEEDDYWQRYAQQPEKNSFAESHLQPRVVAAL
jgi:hypothetical protein